MGDQKPTRGGRGQPSRPVARSSTRKPGAARSQQTRLRSTSSRKTRGGIAPPSARGEAILATYRQPEVSDAQRASEEW